jgi:hypothetical protein
MGIEDRMVKTELVVRGGNADMMCREHGLRHLSDYVVTLTSLRQCWEPSR